MGFILPLHGGSGWPRSQTYFGSMQARGHEEAGHHDDFTSVGSAKKDG
jgi:hypothetical protein